MGGVFSSAPTPDKAADAKAPAQDKAAAAAGGAGSSSGSGSRKKRSRGGKKKGGAAAASAAKSADGASYAAVAAHAEEASAKQSSKLNEVRKIPIALEQAWQEAERLGKMLHGWSGSDGGLAAARVAASAELAMAFKNIGALAAKGKAKSSGATILLDPPHAESALDNGASEPNDFDRKRTKRLVRKLRDAARKAPPLRVPKVADPWGDEDIAWRVRWLDERATALILVLDGIDVRGEPLLRGQRKQILRALSAMGEEAKQWVKRGAAEAEAAKKAEADKKAAVAAHNAAIKAKAAEDAAAAAATAAAASGADAPAAPAPSAPTPAASDAAAAPKSAGGPKASADGWVTINTKKHPGKSKPSKAAARR
uniref:Uncharacterized protein n=1 Tax=Cafeteria roenbergensis TaxID=33653 RepID=A0A7S0K2W8_CAFRO